MLRVAASPTFLRFLVLQIVVLAVAQAQKCYYTNGQETDSTFRPCFPDQEESFCCSLAKHNDVPNTICLTGGFCYNQDPYYRGVVRQGACTDSTWQSPECPSLSHEPWDRGFFALPCPLQGRGYWCASNGTDCCENAVRHDLGYLMNVTVTSFSGSVSSSSPSTAPSTSPSIDAANPSKSASIPTCASNANSSNSHDGTAAIAGVGAALGACLLIALVALFVQRRVYMKKLRSKDEMISSLSAAGIQPRKAGPVEVPTRMPIPAELGPPEAHEVEGTKRSG